MDQNYNWSNCYCYCQCGKNYSNKQWSRIDEEKPSYSDSDSDTETPEVLQGDVVGNIKCIYDINQRNIYILSEDF